MRALAPVGSRKEVPACKRALPCRSGRACALEARAFPGGWEARVSENGSGGLGGGRWWRRMVARRPDEHDRVSTPLELFFDLCFVVAVSQAAAGLHHAVSENHVVEGVLSYLLVFFAIWWAWMNFTWFASAYDTDDALYRLTTLVQISGGLVLAAGVPRALETHDFTIITIGYVIMRLAMVAQWLRAASTDPPRRRAALRYAVGITVVQVGWILRLGLSQRWFLVAFLGLATAELLVPVFAERAAATTWHPHHIVRALRAFHADCPRRIGALGHARHPSGSRDEPGGGPSHFLGGCSLGHRFFHVVVVL